MSKQDGKNEIITGLGSLLVLVFGYLLLNTINPDILNLNFGLKKVNLDFEGSSTESSQYYSAQNSVGETGAGCRALDTALLNGETFTSNAKRLEALKTKDNAGGSGFYKISPGFSRTSSETLTIPVMKKIITRGPFKNNDDMLKFIYQEAKKNNVETFLALSMWQHESGWGDAGVAAHAHNIGNLRPGSKWKGQLYQSTSGGNFRNYKETFGFPQSWKEGIKDYFLLIGSYTKEGTDTVEEIVTKYAPCSDKNDTLKYIRDVRADLDRAKAELK